MEYNKLVKIHKRGKKYNEWAKAVIDRDKRCVICGRTDNLSAHHLNSWYYYPELRYDIDNGVALCGRNGKYNYNCHTTLHCDYKKSFRSKCTIDDFYNFKKIAEQYMNIKK